MIPTPTLLKPGTHVTTKRGNGVIIKVDMLTYDIPMYVVLLIDGEYADEAIYISDPRITPEISQPVSYSDTMDIDLICAELEFDAMRNLISSTVTCRQCGTEYYLATDTQIIDIGTNEPAFYCTQCGDRL